MTARPGPEAAEAADRVAMHDHLHTPASGSHEILAQRIWTAMYDLGAGLRPGGQWMTLGIDSEIFAGVPTSQKRYSNDAVDALIGQIPVSTRWPLRDTQARPLDTLTAEEDLDCDVVIVNALLNDVDLHSLERRADRVVSDTAAIYAGLTVTRPGGMVAALVSTDWLDVPSPHPRANVADHTDFLGAVRLPAATFRQAAGTDRPVDLILLRHRPHDDRPQHGPSIQPFQNVYEVPLDGHQVRVNEYFDAHPEHILGRLTAEHTPWSDTPRSTVLARGPNALGVRLEVALARIVQDAHRDDLSIPFNDAPRARRGPDSMPDDGATDLSEADRNVIRALRAKRYDPGRDSLQPTDPFDADIDEPDDESPSL